MQSPAMDIKIRGRKGIPEIIFPISRFWRLARSVGKGALLLYVSAFFLLQLTGHKIQAIASESSFELYQNSTLWMLGMVIIIAFLLYGNLSRNMERLLLNRPDMTATVRVAETGEVTTVSFTTEDMQQLELKDGHDGTSNPMIIARFNNKAYELGQALNPEEKRWLLQTLEAAYQH